MDVLNQLKQSSQWYKDLLRVSTQECREPSIEGFAGDEQTLQRLWYQQIFEGRSLTLVDGTALEVIEPGRWNHADGPDFQDAIVLVGGEMRRGNVEVHVRPTDWDEHGHTPNPAYGGVVLHVTWYATPPAKTLPSRIPHLALEKVFFSYETAEQALLSHHSSDIGIEHPCLMRYQKDSIALDRLLVAAGQHRLLIKTERFLENLDAENTAQVFYEGLMRTMGYRRNTEPFKRLAKEFPLKVLEPFPTKTRFAILARMAGLLKETQRELWDLWWESGFYPPLQPYEWDFKGLRPQNHPLRRLAGGMGILHSLHTLLETPIADLPVAITKAADFLREAIGGSSALIGAQRAAAVTTNLFVPYRLALGTLSERQLAALPGEDLSMPMRDTWKRLTGKTTNLPKDGLRQQGLLQIYADFCHNPKVICQTCPLARE